MSGRPATAPTIASEAAGRGARIAWELALPLLLVAIYQVWASAAGNPYFPTIPEIATAFRESWTGQGFTRNVLPSLSNLFRGYGLGLLIGIPIGIALGRTPLLRKTFGPVFSFLLAVPPVALLPLFLLVLGVGPQMQIGVIVMSVAVYMLIATADGVRAVSPTLGDVERVYAIDRPRRLFLITIPAASPQILAAARVSISLAVLVMVVSEMVGASKGIGAVTLLAQQSFAYDQMWAGMVLVAILGIGLNMIFGWSEKQLLSRAGLETQLSTAGGSK